MPSGFFPATEPEAAVFPLLERLRPSVRDEIEREAVAGATVHAELRTAPGTDGAVGLRRFYWSTQRPEPRSPWGFSARTLYCDAHAGDPRLYEFPSEPTLTWLGDDPGPLRHRGLPERVDVLRYIPLRRLTFRVHDGAELPARVIAKVKETIPDKPIRYIVNSHVHFDHSGGLRTYVAEGATVVLVAHALGVMSLLASRAIVLDAGRVVYDGPPEGTPQHDHVHHHDLEDDQGLRPIGGDR